MISCSSHRSTIKTEKQHLSGLATALEMLHACAAIKTLGWVWQYQRYWCLQSWRQGLAHTVGCLGGRWGTSPAAAHTPHRNPCVQRQRRCHFLNSAVRTMKVTSLPHVMKVDDASARKRRQRRRKKKGGLDSKWEDRTTGGGAWKNGTVWLFFVMYSCSFTRCFPHSMTKARKNI